MLKRDWTMSPTINNYSTPNSEHSWEDKHLVVVKKSTNMQVRFFDFNPAFTDVSL